MFENLSFPETGVHLGLEGFSSSDQPLQLNSKYVSSIDYKFNFKKNRNFFRLFQLIFNDKNPGFK